MNFNVDININELYRGAQNTQKNTQIAQKLGQGCNPLVRDKAARQPGLVPVVIFGIISDQRYLNLVAWVAINLRGRELNNNHKVLRRDMPFIV